MVTKQKSVNEALTSLVVKRLEVRYCFTVTYADLTANITDSVTRASCLFPCLCLVP